MGVLTDFFAENGMKMEEFGPPDGVSLAPQLDPPMEDTIIEKNRQFG